MTDKNWYQSKTKWAALLIGVSAALGTVGSYLSGNVDVGTAFNRLLLEVGSILGVFGIRDLPFVNKK